MSFYEGLHAELTKDGRRKQPWLTRIFLAFCALLDRLRR
jgi:hypothetical protein